MLFTFDLQLILRKGVRTGILLFSLLF